MIPLRLKQNNKLKDAKTLHGAKSVGFVHYM